MNPDDNTPAEDTSLPETDAPAADTTQNDSPTTDTSPSSDDTAPDFPADALNRTPEDLADEQETIKTANASQDDTKAPRAKKPSAVKRFFKRVNVYFLIFLLVLIVVSAIAVVTYINSQKDPVVPAIAGQDLSNEDLKELANTDVSIGGSSQTLTIAGSAIIDGQTLMRGNLNVAGNIQAGGSIRGPSLTISGDSNLGSTQASSLQVAGAMAVEGETTLRNLNVAGTSSFSGAMTASQLTVSNLIMSGNASLQVPNHIRFTGPSPSRTINAQALGRGGSASVNGSDTSGTVNLNTGNSPSAGCFVRLNFNKSFSNQPHVIISPVGNAAGRTQYYVDRDQAGFSICTSSPAPGNQAFAFDYFVAN